MHIINLCFTLNNDFCAIKKYQLLRCGHLDAIRFIINYYRYNIDAFRDELLYNALINGHINVANFFMDYGITEEGIIFVGRLILWGLIVSNADEAIAFLIKNGFKYHHVDDTSLFIQAAYHGNNTIIDLLKSTMKIKQFVAIAPAILESAVSNGQIATVKFVLPYVEYINLTYLLRVIMTDDHIEILKFLLKKEIIDAAIINDKYVLN